MCRSLSSLTNLQHLKRLCLSRRDHSGSCCLPKLDRQKHHKLVSLGGLELKLDSLSCRDSGSRCLPVLDLQKHHWLEMLRLDMLPISGLLLPSQKESGLRALNLEEKPHPKKPCIVT